MEKSEAEMSTDISVIVPLYNAKKYLKLAIDSVLNQTKKDIEVIIVDDCSTDGSLELCRELYGHDERVRIIQQSENQGPGAARNRGIAEAHGKYIAFADSDDEMLPDTLSKLFDLAERYNADVVHSTHCVISIPDENGVMPLEMLPDSEYKTLAVPMRMDQNAPKEITLLSHDASERLKKWLNHDYNWVLWTKLFRRDFLEAHGISFGPMKIAEDMIFCLECLMNAGTYLVMPGGGYIYRSSDSLSRGKKSPDNTVKYLAAQLQIAYHMKARLERIEFFRNNPENITRAVEFVLSDLENGFIRPAYQVIGESAMREGKALNAFFTEKFGELSPYVKFLFFQLHNEYPEVIDYMAKPTSDPEFWRKIRARIIEFMKSGTVIEDMSQILTEEDMKTMLKEDNE